MSRPDPAGGPTAGGSTPGEPPADERPPGGDQSLTARVGRLLWRLFPAEDRRVVQSELTELHRRRERKIGRPAADRRLAREWLLSLLYVSAHRLGRRLRLRRDVSGSNPLAPNREATMASELLSDLRHTMRFLRRRPSFALLVALTLGVGVGGAGAVFALANDTLLRPPSGVVDPGGAAYLEFVREGRGGWGLSGPHVEALREAARGFEGIATYDGIGVRVSTGDSRPVDIEGNTIYGEYFELLGVRPAAGRLLAADETGPEADPGLAVISERLAGELFGETEDAVGRQLQANGQTLTVLGVAADFSGTDRSGSIDLWVPRSAFVTLEGFPAERLWSRESRLNQWFVARPRPDVGMEEARTELEGLLRRLADAEPAHAEYLGSLGVVLSPGLLSPSAKERLHRTLGVLAGAAGLLLLIACANVANLLLVRGLRRRGEVAVQRALGASAGRVTRTHLTEALALAAMGTTIGLAVAWLISRAFRGATLAGRPAFEGPQMDPTILGFAAAATLLTTLLAGALPAALAGRFDVTAALGDAGARGSKRERLLRGGSSALQIALSLVLLVSSVLLVRTVRNVHTVDPGLDMDGVSVVTLSLGRDRPERRELDALHRALLDAARNVPGVQAAALNSSYGPYSLVLPGRVALPEADDADAVSVLRSWVAPGWFELLRIERVTGRFFREADGSPGSPLRVVVTASLADRLFGRTDVVGRTMRVGLRDLEEAEIVGVAGDLRLRDLRSPPDDAVFVPYPDVGLTNPFSMLVRTAGPDSRASTANAVREALEAAAPDLPVPTPTPLRDRIDLQLEEQQILARILTLVSALALGLAAVGLYAVVAFAAAGRRREFAIRLALGADERRVGALVLRSAAGIVGAGTALGLLGALALSRVIQSRLFGLGALDPYSYVGSAALLALVALLASWIPARRAVRTDPAGTLRRE